jgi:serine/threonine protein kinase
VQRLTENFCSDVYSLGATLFHALTGRPPFEADGPEAVALQRLTDKPPRLRTLNPRVSAATEEIIDKMLHKNPSLRYPSYHALLEALRDALPP